MQTLFLSIVSGRVITLKRTNAVENLCEHIHSTRLFRKLFYTADKTGLVVQ